MIINNFEAIDLVKARNLIENLEVSNKIEKKYFNDSLGRVISEDIISNINIPDFNKSPLDGYALRRSDVVNAKKESPVILNVIDKIMAGDVSTKSISQGETIRLMTGAKVPDGADCIVRYEDVEFNDKEVKFFSPIGKSDNIIKIGEDIKNGEVIISKDTLITPAEIGVLASLGIIEINVYKKPKVGVFATGSELLEVDEELEDGKIRNSNGYTIENFSRIFGAEVIQYKKIGDKLEDLVDAYKKAIEECDVVVSTGGISVGDSDFVLTALDQIGVKSMFTRVKAKPGGHVFAGIKDDKYIFALSGNPAASFMNFYLYVKPIILKLQGKKFETKKVKSILLNGFEKSAKVSRILRANTFYKDGKFYTELESRQESGVLSTMVLKNSIAILKSGEKFAKNDEIDVEFLYE